MDSQTSLLLATVTTEALAGGVPGFLLGYGLRKVASILLKVTAIGFTLVALFLTGLASQGIVKIDWQALFALVGRTLTAVAQAVTSMIPTLTEVMPATGGFALGFAAGVMKK